VIVVRIHSTKTALAEADRLHDEIVQAVKSAMNGPGGFTAVARENIKANDQIVTGQLRRATLGEVESEDNRVLGIVRTEKYGPYVEYGTKPHWAPIQPLLDWVQRRGLGIEYNTARLGRDGKMKATRNKAKTEAAQRSLAYAIQRKIARYGTEAKPFMASAVDAAFKKLLERLRRVFGGEA
jgi:hypothetical protein